jgi:hypothetical protein
MLSKHSETLIKHSEMPDMRFGKSGKRYIFIYCLALAILLFIACGDSGGRRRFNPPDTETATIAGSIPADTVKPVETVKPVVNVYIENSGSMDGYVTGVTEFEQTIYNYLSDIIIADIVDSMKLLYINNEILPQGVITNDSEVLRDFIEKIEPSTFKLKGGNRKTSDISDVIKSVLANTKENDIAILVTDGIFSPGKKNAKEYLVNQEIGFKNNMSDYLKKYPNTAVIVYQLFSKFKGTYYNNVDAKIPLDGQRPYYIWIIGRTDNLVTLRKEAPENKFNGSGITKMFSIVAGNRTVDYAVKARSGGFEISRNNPRTEIKDLKSERGKGVRFAVNVNFDDLLLDDEYLTDSTNYELNHYELRVKRNDNKLKYTHSLNFTSTKVRNGELSVKLKMSQPNWEDVNDDDGSAAVAGKTFGIKYQINGIYKAFTNKNEYYTEIKINIK